MSSKDIIARICSNSTSQDKPHAVLKRPQVQRRIYDVLGVLEVVGVVVKKTGPKEYCLNPSAFQTPQAIEFAKSTLQRSKDEAPKEKDKKQHKGRGKKKAAEVDVEDDKEEEEEEEDITLRQGGFGGQQFPDRPRLKRTETLFVKRYRALYDFQAQESDELSFKRGDVLIFVSKIDDNWLQGKFKGKQGIFPVDYVRLLN